MRIGCARGGEIVWVVQGVCVVNERGYDFIGAPRRCSLVSRGAGSLRVHSVR